MFFSNSDQVLPQVLKAIDEALKKHKNPCAAFDADGTLWSCDVGDIFFDYIIKNKVIALPPDPWGHYLNIKGSDPHSAYLWLAQIFNGQSLDQVRSWAQEAFEASAPHPTFKEQKEIISYLQSRNVEIYIVTASIKWAVEPYAHLYGIPMDHVIGVETKVINNRITNEQKGPVTFQKGKVDGLLLKTKRNPFFVAGNTFGDLPLLEAASHIQLAIHSSQPHQKIYDSEKELLELAKKRNWFYFLPS